MNASTVSALLAQRAEAVCRKYLPHGKKQGRYWCAGDARGAPGRSLFVRLSPPGTPGKFTDAATGEHGDLLDIIRIATGSRSLREALAEARRFLAQPAAAPRSTDRDTYDRAEAARNLWDRCGPIDSTHAEAYLAARAIHRCRFPALRFHASLPYRSASGAWRRFPALIAAVTGDDNALQGVPRPWLDTVRPRAGAAAALAAGSLGAFVPPKHVTRLIVAQDRDDEGERASRRLQLRCTRLGIACCVLLPAGNDFNDDLREFGANPLARRLAPLAALRAAGPGDSSQSVFTC